VQLADVLQVAGFTFTFGILL